MTDPTLIDPTALINYGGNIILPLLVILWSMEKNLGDMKGLLQQMNTKLDQLLWYQGLKAQPPAPPSSTSSGSAGSSRAGGA